MKKHLLLEKAFIYPVPKCNPDMNGCYFDVMSGYWKSENNTRPVIFDSDRPKPQSKKSDIETGEDRKGE